MDLKEATFVTIDKDDVRKAEDLATEKVKAYKAASIDPAADKEGLKTAADEALVATLQWVEMVYDVNRQLKSASSLLSDMLLGKYDPVKKGH